MLKDSPDDSELLALKAELENLIQLTKDYLKQQAPAASSSRQPHDHKAGSSSASGSAASTASFTTGTNVMAKWHKDHKFYPALIANVAGTEDDPVYTVIFEIDKSTEVLRKGDVKPLTESKKRAMQFSESNRDSDGAASDSAPSTKKTRVTEADKTEKKAQKEVDRKSRVAEQNNRQSSWQSFAKKSTKKGVHIPGVKGESLFKTPDNPYGRGEFAQLSLDKPFGWQLTHPTSSLGTVGVTGSGKGMTSYAAKQRVKFSGAEGEGEQQP